MYQVLIVEDDPMVANIDKLWVERCGDLHVVAVCRDGAEALSTLEQMPVELIILALKLPDMNGLELLSAIRSRDVPVDVIVVSAMNSPATFHRARLLGALDYLVKPFDEARLRQAASLFLRQRKLLESDGPLSQTEIDTVLPTMSAQAAVVAAKGIQAPTLRLIREFINRSRGQQRLTNETISKGTGLSVVSVRRYMNHLTSLGEVTVDMEYNTGGRPVTIYHVL